MTNATVPVPVSELVSLRDDISNWETSAPLAAVLAHIPTPPKVGDFVTAESVKDLPAGTVLRDNEDDIWLVGPQAIVSYLNPARSDPRVLAVDNPAWGMYEPVIISLPRD